LKPASRNPNEYRLFQWNSRNASDLAFSNSFVGFRLFATFVVFCQRNDTRNDTRTRVPPKGSRSNPFEVFVSNLPEKERGHKKASGVRL
jgi:hypothetical protein